MVTDQPRRAKTRDSGCAAGFFLLWTKKIAKKRFLSYNQRRQTVVKLSILMW
jgi:hypothetical protein